jgi:hypothetical protein
MDYRFSKIIKQIVDLLLFEIIIFVDIIYIYIYAIIETWIVGLLDLDCAKERLFGGYYEKMVKHFTCQCFMFGSIFS